jgi:hypothetical protein
MTNFQRLNYTLALLSDCTSGIYALVKVENL